MDELVPIRYVGPYNDVEIAATGLVVKHGETVELASWLADSLLEQDVWERSDDPPGTIAEPVEGHQLHPDQRVLDTGPQVEADPDSEIPGTVEQLDGPPGPGEQIDGQGLPPVATEDDEAADAASDEEG